MKHGDDEQKKDGPATPTGSGDESAKAKPASRSRAKAGIVGTNTAPEQCAAPGQSPATPDSSPPPPASWPPAPAPAGWPPAPQGGSPAPQSWPPADLWRPPQPGWSPAPVWSPAPQAQPPAPQGQPPAQPGWPPVPGTWTPYAPPAPSPRRNLMPQIAALVIAVLIAFGAGMAVDRAVAAPPAQQPQTTAQAPLQDFQLYQQALKDIKGNFVGRNSLTDKQLLYGSIKGLVDSLGDTNHSRFLTPDEYKQLTSALSGSVAGIGVLVSQVNGTFVIDRVIPGSPAEAGGVKAGDQVTAVDGKSVAGLDFDGLAALIRGPIGTSVTVTVIHSGSTASVNLTMKRAEVTMPLVDAAMIPGTHIYDIALFEFSSGAADQVHQAVAAAKAAHATSLVLDLRGNPGGIADEAQWVASEFLSSGVVYIEEDASGRKKNISVDTSRQATALPMTVLVDGGTASAAEIVAGALQDASRAALIGTNTVGTGTVLQPFALSDGSVLLLGVSDWLTPNGSKIFGVGIKPDKTVAMPVGAQPLDPNNFEKMTAAVIKASGDTQLLEAVKELGG